MLNRGGKVGWQGGGEYIHVAKDITTMYPTHRPVIHATKVQTREIPRVLLRTQSGKCHVGGSRFSLVDFRP